MNPCMGPVKKNSEGRVCCNTVDESWVCTDYPHSPPSPPPPLRLPPPPPPLTPRCSVLRT
eukprot:6543140-Pyramimonas_sp.AAC.1